MTDQLRRVDWNGIQASYTPEENLLMQAVRAAGADDAELATLHALKGLFEGRWL